MLEEKLDIKLLVLSVLIIILLLSGFVLYQNEEKSGSGTVMLYIDFGDSGRLYTGNLTVWENGGIVSSTGTENNTTTFEFRGISGENLSVLSVLMKGAEWGNFTVHYSRHFSPEGVFIESICGVENDQKNWQYYINGEYGVRSCDSMPVRNGDIIRWVYK